MQASLASLTFGAEFEVILPRGFNRETAARAVSNHSGITVNHAIGARGSWKIVSDASVSGNGIGLEFVSPILKGEDGLEQVRKITAALTAIGATVNTSTGFHVHVGAGDQADNAAFFKNVLKLYGRFETALDAIHPASRRASTNSYCKSVRSLATRVDTASTTAEIFRLANDRYHKVNLAAFAKHRTVEFRQHAGTVDGNKAVNWITLCLRIVAAAKAGKTGEEVAVQAARDFSRLDAKARAVAEAIAKPEGATANEVRAAHGFKALSIKRQAAVAGLQVRVVTTRGVERFFLVAAPEGATVSRTIPATLDGLVEVLDATPEEAAFLRARAVRLAQTA
jgi:hypothetical protein